MAGEIQFFTPIKYDYYPLPLDKRILQAVDEYFYLKGQIAVANGNLNRFEEEEVNLYLGKGAGFHTVFKVSTYVICLVGLIAAATIQTTILKNRFFQIYLAISSIPIFLLITKVVLRTLYQFSLRPDQIQPREVAAPKKSILSKKKVEDALRKIQHPSFLSRLKSAYAINAHLPNGQAVWLLPVLQVFRDAYIEDSCHPVVTWSGSNDFCLDSVEVFLKNGASQYSFDCINSQKFQAACLSFKRKLNELNQNQISLLQQACINGYLDAALDVDVYSCFTDLQSITIGIKERYQDRVLSPQIDELQDWIFDRFKKTFKEKELGEELEILQDAAFADSICSEIVEEIFTHAIQIEGDVLLLQLDNLVFELDFKRLLPIDVECLERDQIRWLSVFPKNDLNSASILDDPYISNEPLEIVTKLQNNSLEEIQKSAEYRTFLSWFKQKYYNKFCSALIRQLQPMQPAPKPSEVGARGDFFVIRNDLNGESFNGYIQRQFQIQKSWDLNGSCFIAALFPEIQKNEQAQKVNEIRIQLSEILLKTMDNYLNYVVVIPGFSNLRWDEQERLRKLNWAIADEDSIEARRKAIKARADLLTSSQTFLMEAEYELIAQIIGCPIYVYKRMAQTFRINKSRKLLPSTIFGSDCKGKPRHLYDDSDHYLPLNPK